MKQTKTESESIIIPYLEIFDKFNNLVKTYKNLESDYNLQMDDLQNGQYFIKTIIDNEIISEQIFIQK
jgi:hypothetical protein